MPKIAKQSGCDVGRCRTQNGVQAISMDVCEVDHGLVGWPVVTWKSIDSHIDRRDLLGVLRGPVQRAQRAPAETFQHRFRRQAVLLDQVGIEGVHVPQCHRRTVHVLDVDAGDVETLVQQRDVRLRRKAEELRTPNLRPAVGGFPGRDENALPPANVEIEPLVTVPLGRRTSTPQRKRHQPHGQHESDYEDRARKHGCSFRRSDSRGPCLCRDRRDFTTVA